MSRQRLFAETDHPDGVAADQNTNGASGWNDTPTATEPIGIGPHKGRHKYVDGVCIKCGAVEGQSNDKPKPLGRPRASNNLTIEMVASMLWLGGGIGLEHLPESTPVVGSIAKPVEREDGSEGVAPSKAAGRMMQLEASIAGRRIDKAIKGTVVGKFINAILNATGPWAELVPLILPPVLMAGAAAFPALIERFPVLKGMMVATMIPVLTEAAKLAEQQGALIENLNQVSEATITEAMNTIQNVMRPDSVRPDSANA